LRQKCEFRLEKMSLCALGDVLPQWHALQREHPCAVGKRRRCTRAVELRYEKILAGETPAPKEPATVVQAVAAYLADKRSQHLESATIRKRVLWFEKELLTWCKANGVHFVRDLDLQKLRLSSGHFQCHQVVGGDARRGHSSPRSIQNPRNPVGALPTVQPSFEVGFKHQSGSTSYSLSLCLYI